MKVQLLGTGSADGWPNPFCACDSCEAQRATGRPRLSSCALVDDVLLVDWGPNLASAAGRGALRLDGIHHILFTHGHPDHLAPDFLLWRSWIPGLRTLHIYGPPHAISRFEHWVDPQAPVVFHVVEAGDEFTARTTRGPILVRALPAAHGHGNGDLFADEALLYDITAIDGDRLLYATDTGPLQAATLEAVHGRDFSLVLIEETFGRHVTHGTGHLDLTTLPTTLDALREAGAVTPATDVVAFHLSHHNPPAAELAVELAQWGARIVDDGAVIDTRASDRTRILIVGGARSGKSRYAEALASTRAGVTYVATGGRRPDDAEWTARIQAHQARRPSSWTTIESTDLAAIIRTPTQDTLLVDCVSLWLTDALDDAGAWSPEGQTQEQALARVAARIDELVESVRDSPNDLILVTNEVGQGVVPATPSGRLFRDLLGVTNARLAAVSTEAQFMIAGRTLPLAAVTPLLSKDADA